MAYIRSQASGNYSNPATWAGGVVPTTGDYACTWNHQITLDIDPLAVLSINQQDITTAGGSTTLNFSGAFIIPEGTPRTIVGLRYPSAGVYIEARYWRIYMTENNGDAYYSLQEVNIIGGSGLSLVSPATATSQSSYYDAGWYQALASKLVDGSTENGETDVWVSSGGSPTEWVSFDLGQRMPVKAFKLLPQVHAPVTVSRAPKTFKIQYSNDNANWSDAYIAENQTSWSVGVYNEYILPYQPNASSGGSVDLTSVIQKLDSIKKDTTFIKSIVA